MGDEGRLHICDVNFKIGIYETKQQIRKLSLFSYICLMNIFSLKKKKTALHSLQRTSKALMVDGLFPLLRRQSREGSGKHSYLWSIDIRTERHLSGADEGTAQGPFELS